MGTCCSRCDSAETVRPYLSPASEEAAARYQHCTLENTPPLIFKGDHMPCRVLRVVDGDTVDLVTDAFPMIKGMHRYRCRLYGIDTPESRPLKSNPLRLEEIAAAHRATEALTTKLKESSHIVHVNFCGNEKFGRLLVILFDANGNNINEWLIAEGHAVPYFGKTKMPFKPAPASFEAVLTGPSPL